MTAEDPVEFNLHGINQVQMKEQIGLNFATALRSFLRQDPNIILVGEIRDFETAEIAVKAALTGHLVLSTLHTNDAPSTINRLMNMGIEPFLVATSVNLICAQRLVRKICKECKEEIQLPPQALVDIGFAVDEAPEGQAVQGPRLRDVQQHRLQGPRRTLRGHGDHRRDPRADPLRRLGARAQAEGDRGRDDLAAPARACRRSGRRSPRSRKFSARRCSSGPTPRRTGDRRQVRPSPASAARRRWSTRAATDLHVTTNSPPQIRIDGKMVPLQLPAAGRRGDEAAGLQRPDRQSEAPVRGEPRARLLVRRPRAGPLPRQRLLPARRRGRRLPHDPLGDPQLQGARGFPRSSRACATSRAAWCWSPGPTGSGKSTTLAAMLDKINARAARAHRDDRGPDRVPARPQELPRQPARAARRHPLVPGRAALGAPPGPGRRADRRDARPRDDRVGPAHRRDRPPDLRDPAHELGVADDQPDHRRLPARTSSRRCARSCRWCSRGSSASPSSRAPTAGRVLAMEILVPNSAIRNLIREDKVHQIYSAMQVGQLKLRDADVQPVAGDAVLQEADHAAARALHVARTRTSCRR